MSDGLTSKLITAEESLSLQISQWKHLKLKRKKKNKDWEKEYPRTVGQLQKE